MSVSLIEVLNSAGYDPLNNLGDAQWLLSVKTEAEQLFEQVEEYVDEHERDNSL